MRAILTLLVCIFPLLAFTQDTQESNTEDPGATTQQQATSKQKASSENSEDAFETPDSFEATEKVSEDYSIPFPVDI